MSEMVTMLARIWSSLRLAKFPTEAGKGGVSIVLRKPESTAATCLSAFRSALAHTEFQAAVTLSIQPERGMCLRCDTPFQCAHCFSSKPIVSIKSTMASK